jgi:hypothetical protein
MEHLSSTSTQEMNHQEVLNIDSGTSNNKGQQQLEPEEVDLLFAVLKGKAIATVAVKRTLFLAFASKKSSDLFDNTFCKCTDVTDLFIVLHASKREHKRWNATFCAQELLKLHKLVSEYDKVLEDRRTSARGHQQQDKSVKELKKLITKYKTCVKGDTERNKNKSGRCTKNTRNIGVLQEENPFEEVHREVRACIHCKHTMMMAIESKESIDAANAELKRIFDKEMKVWVNTNVSQRGKKPKAKTPASTVVILTALCKLAVKVALHVCNFPQMMILWGLFKIQTVVRGI